MPSIDATLFPYPLGNTSVRRFALEARELGFGSIVAVNQQGLERNGFRVIGATLIREHDIRAVINSARQKDPAGRLLIVNGASNSFNRAVAQVRGVHMIRHLHKTEKNSFDHVIARIMAENRVAVDIDVKPLIMGEGSWRQKVFQRYRDIINLHNRFGFPLTLSSNARSITEMVPAREMLKLASLIGLTEEDAEKAIGSVTSLLEPSGAVKVIS